MAYMSYCRFEGTYNELVNCIYALQDGDKLSENEERYRKMLDDLCEEYLRVNRNYEDGEYDED